MGTLDPVRTELEAKAMRFRYEQLLRLERVGYQLLSHLPEKEKQSKLPGLEPMIKPWAYSGMRVANVDATQARVFNLPVEKGVVVTVVVPSSPAEVAGVQVGDLLDSLDGKPVRNAVSFQEAISKKRKPGETVTLQISRAGAVQSVQMTLASVPLPITFAVWNSEAINAFVTPEGLVSVSTGLLRFVNSDDELAAAIGHELAHLTKGHISQKLGNSILAAVIGGAVAGAVGSEVVGDVVSAGIQSGYSQEKELEADDTGLEYVYAAGFNPAAGAKLWERFAVELPQSMVKQFLATHPASPERMTALKIKAEGLTGLPMEVMEEMPSTPSSPVQGLSVAPQGVRSRPFLSRQIDRFLAENVLPEEESQ